MNTHTSSFVGQLGRLFVSLATVAATGVGIVVASTGAMFTDTDAIDMEVSTGWVDIAVGGGSMLPLTNLKPGDSVYRSLNFVNSGTLGFMYDITAVRPNGPNGVLTDTILVETWETETADNCSSSHYSSGNLMAPSSTLTNLHVHDHLLAPGNAETLCFRLTLPSGTSNSVAGKSASVSLTIATWQS